MDTIIILQFNDNKIIQLSTSSFLYKNSKLFQSFDLDDNLIPILCPSSYIIDNDICLFDDNTNLSFMFTLRTESATASLLPLHKFINICKFLDIICYENKDKSFSKQFIIYVMNNIKGDIYMKDDINDIHYFMQPEIRSIMNYINNSSHENEIMCCTQEFYNLYLTEYKEEVVRYNRRDIYELSTDKSEYYRYIHKYDNQITHNVMETKKYKKYITDISIQLIDICDLGNLDPCTDEYPDKCYYDISESYDDEINFDKIIDLIDSGANINFQDKYGSTALHVAACTPNNIEVITYLVEHGADINLKDYGDCTALHNACHEKENNLKVIQYLVEHGANIHLKDKKYGNTALHNAVLTDDNLEVVQYLIEQGANIHLKNKNGDTALHYASNTDERIEVVQYLVEHGADVNALASYNFSALHQAAFWYGNIKIIQYLIEHGADVHIKNAYGKTAFQMASSHYKNDKVVNYLKQFNNQNKQNKQDN